MQAEVLPEPTAPTMSTPVYSPVSGTTSQEGRSLSRGTTGWWSSPITSDGASSSGDAGQAGSWPLPPPFARGLQPDSPDREAEAAEEHHGDGRRHVVPDADHRVEARIVVGDQVQHGVAAHAGERCPERVSDGGRRSEAHEYERRRLQHRAGTLPGGIHGRERPRRGQRV